MDSDVARAFLRDLTAWAPDETMTVIVGIVEDGAPRVLGLPHADCDTFGARALAAAGEWEREGRNVYYSAAALRPNLAPGSRGTAADIHSMLAIVVDLDDPEAAAGWEERAKVAGLWPSRVVRSSATPTPRVQLVYLLKEPCEDIAAWRAAARRVECWFGGDWCSKDPAHVWRLPGTTNFPTAKKQRAGRVAEPAILIQSRDVRYEPGDFDALPEGTAPVGEDVDVAAAMTAARPTAAWAHSGQIMEHLPDWLQAEMCAGIPEDRSRLDTRIAKESCRAGIGLGDFLELYRLASLDREGFTDKYRERARLGGGRAEQYLVVTYERGRAAILATEGSVPEARCFGVSANETIVDNEEPRWVAYIKRAADFEGLPYPELQYWSSPWLPKNSIVMVHGRTGHGKSRWLLHQTFGLACGKSLPGGAVEEPTRVLYLDGEQSRHTVQQTLMELRAEYGDDEGRFMLLPASFFDGDQPNFTKADHKLEFIRAAQAVDAKVLVIDNVRSLYPGMVENDANAWADINAMLRWLRDKGYTVVWVHHDRKSAGEATDMTFAGSSHAATVSELQIHISQYSKDDRLKIKQELEDSSKDPEGQITRYFKNAIQVRFFKNRLSDLDTQRDHSVVFFAHADENRVSMQLLAEPEAGGVAVLAPFVLNLPPQDIAFALSAGFVAGVGAFGSKPAEISRFMRDAGVPAKREQVKDWLRVRTEWAGDPARHDWLARLRHACRAGL